MVDLFRQGKFHRVPVMVGHTRDEMRLMVAIYENDAGAKLTTAQAQVIAKNFGANVLTREGSRSRAKIRAPGTTPDPGGVVAAMFTDFLFASGLSNDADALAKFVPVDADRSNDPNAPESHVHGGEKSQEQRTD